MTKLEQCGNAIDFLSQRRGRAALEVSVLAYNPTSIGMTALNLATAVVTIGRRWSFSPGPSISDSLARGALLACESTQYEVRMTYPHLPHHPNLPCHTSPSHTRPWHFHTQLIKHGTHTKRPSSVFAPLEWT